MQYKATINIIGAYKTETRPFADHSFKNCLQGQHDLICVVAGSLWTGWMGKQGGLENKYYC